jgi:hypothetical protein
MFVAQVIDKDALAPREADGGLSASNDHDGTVKVNNMEINEVFALQDDEPYGSQFNSDWGYNPSDYDSGGFLIAKDEASEDDREVVFIQSLHVTQYNMQKGEAPKGTYATNGYEGGDSHEHSTSDLFDHGVTICAMHPTSPADPPRVYCNSIHRPEGTMKRPVQETAENMCLTTFIEINRVKAYTLFDSGSTTDSTSPDFTQVAKLDMQTLEQLVTLQLGCVGSQSKINYGTEDEVKFTSINCKTYLDVANLDRYDCILGTPFMRRHKIALDFGSNEIVIHGKLCVPALPNGGGTTVTTTVTPQRSK